MKPGTVTERLQTESETDRTRESLLSCIRNFPTGGSRAAEEQQTERLQTRSGWRQRGSRQRQPTEATG